MSKKKIIKKIEKLDKQIREHELKIEIADSEGKYELSEYHKKEILAYKLAKQKEEERLLPRKKRLQIKD